MNKHDWDSIVIAVGVSFKNGKIIFANTTCKYCLVSRVNFIMDYETQECLSDEEKMIKDLLE